MSYSMWVQRFGPGSDGELSRDAFWAIFGPHIRTQRPESCFFRIVPPDGQDSDLYADLEPSFRSVMANHFCVGAFSDLFVEFARQSEAVIYTQDGAAMLTHPDQRAFLPTELRDQVFLVKNGADLEAAIGQFQ